MSARIASCPSCGAEVAFRAGSSLVAVCAYCSTAVARVGDDVGELEILGKVAPLAALGSPLSLGMGGQWKGRPFTVVGRLQLDYGAGPWNEWYVAFADGDWAWIAEAQGKVYLTFPRPVPRFPRFAEWRVGTRFTLSGTALVAVERRSASLVSAEGELPGRVELGTKLRYVDVEGPSGVFGTVDFGTTDAVQAIYLGHQLAYTDLFARSDLAATPEAAAHVLDLKCPSCGAAVALREPDEAQRVTCAQCEALLDVKKGSPLFMVNAATRKGPKPHLPLGAQGKLKNKTWTVYGHLIRSVISGGVRYAWDEYLLRSHDHEGWRWLTCTNGHWSFVEPASAADVESGWRRTQKYRGRTYRHFTTSSPAVEHIAGEFYWKVAIGERVRATDWVSPPYVLSEEVGGEETVWSHGQYMSPGEIQAMFKLKEPPSRTFGVASNQPDPLAGRRRSVFQSAVLLSAALGAAGLLVAATSNGTVVYEHRQPLAEVTEVVLSERFTLEEKANLEVQVSSDIDNSWLYLGGALIDETTDQVHTFGVELSYYHGVSGGESWSEGGRSDSVYLGEVPAGEYVLRFDPQWEKSATAGALRGKSATYYQVRVRSDVFLASHWVGALGLLWIYPLWLLLRRGMFEGRRWQESDHAS